MKTFFTVKFALAPFAAFFALLGLFGTGIAVAAGFALSAGLTAWRLRGRDIKFLELGGLAIFILLGLADLLWPDVVAVHAATLALAGLGLVFLASVALRRPWTADYSRAAFVGAAESPIFLTVNMILSGLWGVLFLLLATVHALHLASWAATAIVLAGAAASIFGPRLLARWALQRRLAAQEI